MKAYRKPRRRQQDAGDRAPAATIARPYITFT
jgi:hypothetical protein